MSKKRRAACPREGKTARATLKRRQKLPPQAGVSGLPKTLKTTSKRKDLDRHALLWDRQCDKTEHDSHALFYPENSRIVKPSPSIMFRHLIHIL